MKKNILIVFWLFSAFFWDSYAQTVFLEDFSKGDSSLEGWEVGPNDYPVFSEYRIANTALCKREAPEFNLYYCGKETHKGNSGEYYGDGIDLISPQFDFSQYDELNLSVDLYYLPDLVWIVYQLYFIVETRNNFTEDWVELFHYKYEYGTKDLEPPFNLIMALDSSMFKKEGFQIKLRLSSNVGWMSYSNNWFNIDNIHIYQPDQHDLGFFTDYPDVHMEKDSVFIPRVFVRNNGLMNTEGQVNCQIKEFQTGDLIYNETVGTTEPGSLDTVSLHFPPFVVPYSNNLYDVEYQLMCTGDVNIDDNNASFKIDSYTSLYHNILSINVLYSTEFLESGYNMMVPYIIDLPDVLEEYDDIKEAIPRCQVANYIYDDVPDSLDTQTAMAFLHSIDADFEAGGPSPNLIPHIPAWIFLPGNNIYPVHSCFTYPNDPSTDYIIIIDELAQHARSAFSLDIFGTHSGLDYSIMVELTPKAPIVNEYLKLHTVITRSHVPSNANPEIPDRYRVEFFDDVVQMALPDTNGIAFSMDGSETSAKQWEMSFSLKDFWDPEQVKVVTYVQDTFTYDILQCRAVPLQNLWGVGMEEEAQMPAESVLISPNPAKDMLYAQLMLEMPANVDFRLFDINGRDLGILKRSFLGAGNHKVQISVPKHIKTGIYILQTETERELYSQKLNIVR